LLHTYLEILSKAPKPRSRSNVKKYQDESLRRQSSTNRKSTKNPTQSTSNSNVNLNANSNKGYRMINFKANSRNTDQKKSEEITP